MAKRIAKRVIPRADIILRNHRLAQQSIQKKMPIAQIGSDEIFLPNHSGDHSRGRVNTQPTTDQEIANKKYVDDNKSRVAFTAGTGVNFGAGEEFMRTSTVTQSLVMGWTMTRPGSIVGLSATFFTSAFLESGAVAYRVYVEASNVYEGSVSVSSGATFNGQQTQAKEIDTFVAGDVISLAAERTSGNFSVGDSIIVLEVQFDT